jgi:hypothetical protein
MITFQESRLILKATPAALASFESEFGIDLDARYREFLMAGQGGRPQPSRIRFDDRADLIAFIRGFESSLPCFDLRNGIAFFGNSGITGYLSIAASDSGDCWLMKVKGIDSGAIYLWDHDREDVEPVTFRYLTRAFDSFAGFLAAIH